MNKQLINLITIYVITGVSILFVVLIRTKVDSQYFNKLNGKFIIKNGDYMKNKEIYFIDDSLVRGNTLKVIIEMLKTYKPKKIHIRISSPKVLNICNYGIDIPSKEELIMNFNDEKSYTKLMSIDSIKFLGIENLMKVLGNNNYCKKCFIKNDW